MSAETLHIKVKPLPRILEIHSPKWEPESEYDDESESYTDRYSLKYKHDLYVDRNVIRVRTYLYQKHEVTIYESGRKKTVTSSETEPPQIRFHFLQKLYSQSPIPYIGSETPFLSSSNAFLFEGDHITLESLKNDSYTSLTYEWDVIFPQKFSKEQIKKAIVLQDNQVKGSIIISFPNFKKQTKHTLEKSEYNLQRLFPHCGKRFLHETDLINCLASGFDDFRRLDLISRKKRISNSKMTPLQKKVFKKSKEYKFLLEKMKRQKKELKDLLFCLPLKTGEYLLKYKGLEVSTTLLPQVYSKPLSIRFSNLGKRRSKDPGRKYSTSPEKTFLRVSEEIGLSLEKQEIIGCFKPSSELKFRKVKARYIKLSGFFKGERGVHKYHFLEATLSLLYLKDQIYSVDQKGKVSKF